LHRKNHELLFDCNVFLFYLSAERFLRALPSEGPELLTGSLDPRTTQFLRAPLPLRPFGLDFAVF
jgi:hypothetical protein